MQQQVEQVSSKDDDWEEDDLHRGEQIPSWSENPKEPGLKFRPIGMY